MCAEVENTVENEFGDYCLQFIIFGSPVLNAIRASRRAISLGVSAAKFQSDLKISTLGVCLKEAPYM